MKKTKQDLKNYFNKKSKKIKKKKEMSGHRTFNKEEKSRKIQYSYGA